MHCLSDLLVALICIIADQILLLGYSGLFFYSFFGLILQLLSGIFNIRDFQILSSLAFI